MSFGDQTLVLADCVVHWPTREIRREGSAPGRLTATEARLLRYLADHPDRHVGSAELLGEVWGYRKGVRSRTVVVTMHRLRNKIEADAREPVHLLSVTGGGYRFRPLGHASQAASALPGSDGALLGRHEDLERVEQGLLAGRLVSLVGPAGVGKTRLALEVARRALGRTVGGVVWAEVRACRSAEDVVDVLRDALELPPAGDSALPDRLGALLQVLGGRGGCVVVIDNAESCPDAVQTVLLALIGGASQVAWLSTSRSRLGLDGERVMPLAPLAEADAVRLLQLRARTGSDPDDLRTLASRLDRLPLALELAARRLPALGAQGVLDLLDRRLQLLSGGPDQLGLAEALDLSWHVLDAPARTALAALAGFPGTFSLEDARMALSALPGEVFVPDVLQVLVDSHLVSVDTQAGPRRYRLLESVREHARSRDTGQGAAVFCAGLAGACALARARLGTREEGQAMGWLAAHIDTLRGAWAACDEPDLVAELVLAALPVFERQGRARLAWSGLQRAEAAGAVEDPVLRWALRLARLGVLLDVGRSDEARAEAASALERGRELGVDASIEALVRSGLVQRRLGDLELAEMHLREAVSLAEEGGDARLRGRARLELGVVLRQSRSTEAALDALQRARVEARRASDPRTEAIAIGTLGLLHQRAGRRDEALGDLREARRLTEALGDQQSVDILDNNIAGILVLRGETDQALQAYERLVHSLRQRGATRSIAFAQTNRGVLYNRIGQHRRAEDCLREALACFEALALSRGIGACHCQLARMRLATDDPASALDHCAAALQAARSEGSICAQARIMGLMARAAMGQGEAGALQSLDEAVPAEVEGLRDQARLWLERPDARPDIRRALMRG